MTHLSLEASKKIFELIGDYETEQNYSEQAEPDCLCGEHGDPGYILTPKPNFAELIRLLPKIGEKKGNIVDIYECASCGDLEARKELEPSV